MTKNFIFILLLVLLFIFSCSTIPEVEDDDVLQAPVQELIEDEKPQEPSVEESKIEEESREDSETANLPAEEITENEIAEEEDISRFIAEIPESILNTEPPPAPPVPVVQTPVVPPPPLPPPPPPPPVLEPPAVQTPVPPPLPPEEPLDEQPPEDRNAWRRSLDFPSGPPTRLDTLADIGRTPLDSEIIFSRIVRATVGQIVEIPFRGNGWVYLGEIASRRGILYNSRRNDSDGQSFIFTLEEPGTYILKFYRQDFIRDYILNDHVQVIVGESPQAGTGWFGPPVDRSRVIAQPRWPSAAEEAQIRSGTRPAAEPVVSGTVPQTAAPQTTTPPAAETQRPPQTVTPPAADTQRPPQAAAPQTTPSQTATPPALPLVIPPQDTISPPVVAQPETPVTPAPLAPEVIIDRAKEAFEGGNVPAAVALLEQFMETYPGGSDEVYWLLGQFYEANSPSRNILLSLDYYRRLINEYPQSRRFNDARRRIAYLERYYINIQ